ncbi:MAG: diphosphomevalonate decarboxylase [Myxococcales bacterium]|nr:diphosphomevalonate decarboxylase [Myxococcales bacterium]USN51049.1 MAG: diphosphomevalonate decarboxylase [Myxococcales bacterium]
MKQASAYANANIALVKYWGKSNQTLNIPAVSSLSMTLDCLGCNVTVEQSTLYRHFLSINGQIASTQDHERLTNYLETVRRIFSFKGFLSIFSQSSVPIAAGLASSAAFYAALSLALDHFFSLKLNHCELSKLARIGSASAARSIFGGFSGLFGGSITHDQSFAFPLETNLNLAMLVAIVCQEKKSISSRKAMNLTKDSSPFYDNFVSSHENDFSKAQTALASGGLEQLGSIMEHSTLKMHASMWTAQPSINYLQPKTLELMNLIYDIRKNHGAIAYFTMDAGPNVKILCELNKLPLIKSIIEQSGLTKALISSQPGKYAHVVHSC